MSRRVQATRRKLHWCRSLIVVALAIRVALFLAVIGLVGWLHRDDAAVTDRFLAVVVTATAVAVVRLTRVTSIPAE